MSLAVFLRLFYLLHSFFCYVCGIVIFYQFMLFSHPFLPCFLHICLSSSFVPFCTLFLLTVFQFVTLLAVASSRPVLFAVPFGIEVMTTMQSDVAANVFDGTKPF